MIPEAAVSRQILHRFAAISALGIGIGIGLSIAEAESELDLPNGWGKYASMTVGRWARQHASHAELDTAVATVIDNLNNNPPPTNYQHRRRALDGWLIPAEVWEPSIDTLR